MTKNQEMPLVSVVIPTYNRASFIIRAIESVLCQTYKPVEIIVVDDGSTDNTVSIVKQTNDQRVRCIVLGKNSGAQYARNIGIKEANGDWIAFLDSDDEWLPDKLHIQIKVLSKFNFAPDIVIHSNAFKYEHYNKKKHIWKLPFVEGKPDVVYPILLAKPSPMFPALLSSKSSLAKINYLDENLPAYQEWDTSIRLAKHCRFIHVLEPLLIYHIHNEETISKNMKKDFSGYQYIIEKHEKDIKTFCGEKTWHRQLSRLLQKGLEFGLTEELIRLIDKYSMTDQHIQRAYIKHISYCLNNGKWREADSYFSMCSNNYRFILSLLRLCRIFKLKPGHIVGNKEIYND